jgi:HAD superfamily hydrolase (TIGR01509 family)
VALDGIIFDLDGTLVDTNALHVEAWRRVLERRGYRVASDRIADEIGKGGDQLVPSILGREADARDGQWLREQHPSAFAELARERGIKVFGKAKDLVDAVRRRGIRAALGTSSGKEHLRTIESASDLSLSAMFDAVVDSDDIDRSKPAPDVVHAACEKLGLSPAQCALVGDTIFDAESSVRGGVACIGLTCGGQTREALREAGARVVYEDPADLLDHLEDALRIASPGSLHLTHDALRSLMREGLEVARAALSAGEAPIGCALARGDGTVIARAHNEQNRRQDKTAHAEIVAFGRAAGTLPLGARDLILVSTLEPCVMCSGAAMEAGVDTIVFGLRAPADGGTRRVRPPVSPESQMPRIVGDVLANESRGLLEQFLKTSPRPEQAAYVRQLLGAVERTQARG